MKKINILLLLLAALCSTTAVADVVFDETNFPDEAFREAIADSYYDDYGIRLNEGDILTDEMLNLDRLGIYGEGYGIHSVEGIQYFTGLTAALLSDNQIEEISFRGNPIINEVDLRYNPQLRKVDLFGCNLLKQLSISTGNGSGPGQLKKIEHLDHCSSLIKLSVSDQPLEELDLSEQTELLVLSLSAAKITSLDLSQNKKLYDLQCTSLDQLSSINFYVPDPTNPMDIAYGYGIKSLYFNGNSNLQTININGQYLLNKIDINNCPVTHQEFSDCSSLSRVGIRLCENLETIDLSGCENLENLDLSRNPILEEFDLSGNTYLKSIQLYNCPLIKRLVGLRQTANTLESLIVSNGLTSLDVSNFPKLNYLDISKSGILVVTPGNHLNAINFENDINLKTFHHEDMNGRQIQVYSTNVEGEKQYYIPLVSTAAHKGIKDLIEQENNYEDEDTGFDWADVVTESITGATLGELDGEAVLWLDKTTNSDTEGLHRMTYQYLTHAPTTAFPEQYPTTEFYLDWAEATTLRGDVNGNDEVDINDVTLLIDVILGKSVEYNATSADCNTASGDGTIDINDVTALINYVLTGNW